MIFENFMCGTRVLGPHLCRQRSARVTDIYRNFLPQPFFVGGFLFQGIVKNNASFSAFKVFTTFESQLRFSLHYLAL